MKKIMTSLVFVALTNFCLAQSPNYYYYKNQQQSVTLSNYEMYLKFIPNLTNLQKLEILNNAGVKLSLGDSLNIGDMARVHSKITRTTTWFYPCGIPEARNNPFLNLQSDTFSIFTKPAPCEGCPPPPDCTPYSTSVVTNNIETAINYLASNSNITSISKAIALNESTSPTFIGTAEDFFVKLKPSFSILNLLSAISIENLNYIDVSSTLGEGVYKFTLNNFESKNCIAITSSIFESNMCAFATPNFYNCITPTTTDPLWNTQWNLKNTGQNGIVGADIRVEPAWTFTKGAGVKVAVLDNGVQLDHTDLQSNLIQGYDALLDIQGLGAGNALFSEDDHGTACAGIIGAVADNNFGIAGVAPECKIMPIRVYTDHQFPFGTSYGSIESQSRGIHYAWSHGADILSNSWNLDIKNDLLDFEIHEAVTKGRGNKGCIVIFAAGNRDAFHSGAEVVGYPSKLEDVIAVGAMNSSNNRVNISDWGSWYGENLDIVAPGLDIPSLDLNNGNQTFFGTSAACPHVAGVAALVLAANPNLTNLEAKRILHFSCNKVGSYCYNWTPSHPDGKWNNEMGYGRINAYNAVQLATNSIYITSSLNVPQQNYDQGANIAIQLQTPGSPCTTVSGLVGYRIEVTTNITFPYTSNPYIICSSNGWSAANPNNGQFYADVKSYTNTSAVLRTYVYTSYNYVGQLLGHIPTIPQNIKFSYTLLETNGGVILQNSKSNNNFSIIKSFDFENEKTGPTNDIIDEFTNNNKILLIYPNPAKNTIFVSTESFLNNEIKFLQLLTPEGKLINTFKINSKTSNTTQIDISKLISGVYIVKVITDKKIITQKFIKQ